MENQENYVMFSWDIPHENDIDISRTRISMRGETECLELYLKKGTARCGHCESGSVAVKGSRVREIRTVKRDKSPGIIRFHAREYRCLDCGRVTIESLKGRKEERGRMQVVDIEMIVQLMDLTNTYKSVALKYGVTPTTVENVFDRYVRIRRKPLPKVLSVDEIYARKLTRTKYCFIIDSVNIKIPENVTTSFTSFVAIV